MSDTSANDLHGVDLHKIFARVTNLGLAVGIMPPGAYVIMAYFLNTPEMAAVFAERYTDTLLWLFTGLATLSAILGVTQRKSIFTIPCISSEETFSIDFKKGIKDCTTNLNFYSGSIAVYGMMFFFMGGGLRTVMMFSLFSVIVFQLVRPRIETLEMAFEIQSKLVSEGKFSTRKSKFFPPSLFKWP